MAIVRRTIARFVPDSVEREGGGRWIDWLRAMAWRREVTTDERTVPRISIDFSFDKDGGKDGDVIEDRVGGYNGYNWANRYREYEHRGVPVSAWSTSTIAPSHRDERAHTPLPFCLTSTCCHVN
jgi:hypothetical protein